MVDRVAGSVTAATYKRTRRRSIRGLPGASTTSSVPASRRTAAVASAPLDTRHYGQCSRCLRHICLTAVGLIRSHGPNCSGSGQPPVDGSISSATSQRVKGASQSFATTGARATDTEAFTLIPARSSSDINDLLLHHRCRVLKRVPKASRIPAADKLAETLRYIVADPDSVETWVDLLKFTFICFGVPGQRGGQRHLRSLASKVNTAIARFPASSVPIQQQKPFKIRKPSDVN